MKLNKSKIVNDEVLELTVGDTYWYCTVYIYLQTWPGNTTVHFNMYLVPQYCCTVQSTIIQNFIKN